MFSLCFVTVSAGVGVVNNWGYGGVVTGEDRCGQHTGAFVAVSGCGPSVGGCGQHLAFEAVNGCDHLFGWVWSTRVSKWLRMSVIK